MEKHTYQTNEEVFLSMVHDIFKDYALVLQIDSSIHMYGLERYRVLQYSDYDFTIKISFYSYVVLSVHYKNRVDRCKTFDLTTDYNITYDEKESKVTFTNEDFAKAMMEIKETIFEFILSS